MGSSLTTILSANDGKLIITPEKNYTSTYLYQGNVFPNDMEASYTMTFVEGGDPAYGSGFLFWAKDYTRILLPLDKRQWLVCRSAAGG